jgi:hypothetical protein
MSQFDRPTFRKLQATLDEWARMLAGAPELARSVRFRCSVNEQLPIINRAVSMDLSLWSEPHRPSSPHMLGSMSSGASEFTRSSDGYVRMKGAQISESAIDNTSQA